MKPTRQEEGLSSKAQRRYWGQEWEQNPFCQQIIPDRERFIRVMMADEQEADESKEEKRLEGSENDDAR